MEDCGTVIERPDKPLLRKSDSTVACHPFHLLHATSILSYPLDSPTACATVFIMNRGSIRKHLKQPGPLIFRTADGNHFLVPHPEEVFVGRFNVAIEDEDGGFDFVDPLHIVSIRPAFRSKKRKNAH